MQTAILYVLITTALYYIGAWAEISKPLWSRYPKAIASFMACPVCVGFWYGALAGTGGWFLGLTFLGLEGWPQIPAAALGGLVWTPFSSSALVRLMASFPEPG